MDASSKALVRVVGDSQGRALRTCLARFLISIESHAIFNTNWTPGMINLPPKWMARGNFLPAFPAESVWSAGGRGSTCMSITVSDYIDSVRPYSGSGSSRWSQRFIRSAKFPTYSPFLLFLETKLTGQMMMAFSGSLGWTPPDIFCLAPQSRKIILIFCHGLQRTFCACQRVCAFRPRNWSGNLRGCSIFQNRGRRVGS